jgi:hypothetical protein
MNDIASLATAGYVMIETLADRMPSRSGGLVRRRVYE